MKTEAIKETIINQFQTISKKAKVTPEKEYILPTWGLVYKNNGTRGLVTQFGVIERNGAKIDIVDGEVRQVKKPFYTTWKRTLKNISKMLKKVDANLENEKVVKKNIVNQLCFPNDFSERIERINKNLAKK